MFTRLHHHYPRTRRPERRGCRPRLEALEDRCLLAGNVVLDWNRAVLDAVVATSTRGVVATRHIAIVQAAMYDAVNSIDRTHTPYFVDVTAAPGTSREAAAAVAAYRVGVSIFPSQVARFDATLARSLEGIPVGLPLLDGIVLGDSVANALLDLRRDDGWDRTVDYTPGTNPGDWQPTPPAFLPVALPHWDQVTPFTLTSAAQFRPQGPPALTSREYTAAFIEVKELGAIDSPIRTAEGTEIARFWNDPSVIHWNEIAANVSEARGLTLSQNARLFALANLAMADAYIGNWDARNTFNLWRPVTAIRAADTDGNPDTDADPDWTPLLVTPNIQSYNSGHSMVGAAASRALVGFFGTDNIAFTSTSTTLPGVTRAHSSFSAAANENARSRLLGGIHWTFDNLDGLSAGRAVGDYIVNNFLLPVGGAGVGQPPPPALPVTVDGVVVNDGSAQRSMVTSLTVAFTGPVTLDAAAFELRGQDGSLVELAVATTEVDGRTVAVLSFSGAGIVGGSLADGNYTLSVRGELIRDALGRALDGDGDGATGGDRVDALFRLYGDSDGDRAVDELDQALFAGTFGRTAHDPEFLGYFDFAGDGDVDELDRDEFLLRLGTRLDP